MKDGLGFDRTVLAELDERVRQTSPVICFNDPRA